MTEQERFEDWYRIEYAGQYESMDVALEKRNGVYIEGAVDDRWEVWQAGTAQAVSKWISVDDRLPEKELNVLIFVVTGYKLQGSIVARYIPKITEPYTGEYSEFGDYDEETDTTYCPAGWYAETAYMGDEYSSYFVDDKVTHWRPLPEPPTAQDGE